MTFRLSSSFVKLRLHDDDDDDDDDGDDEIETKRGKELVNRVENGRNV